MLTVTLAELRGRVRVYTDTVNSPTPTDQTIDDGLNASLRELYAKLSETGDYLVTSTLLTTAAGQGVYDLPDNFWKLRSVVWLRDVRDAITLYRFEDRDRAYLFNRVWSSSARYRLDDVAFTAQPKIELLPAPDAGYSIRVGYVPDPPTISITDGLSCAPGMDEWIVLNVTIRILGIEETDTTIWERLRAECFATMVTPAVALRDENRTQTISDADADEAW